MAPLSTGLLQGLNATGAGASIPQTLDGIANASDPLQAFADACGMDFKMDYLWIGNPATGNIIELGGSGLDLVSTNVDQGQADARLGAGNTCLFNATTDHLRVSSSALNAGSGSLAMFCVNAFDAGGGNTLCGKVANSLGYFILHLGASDRRFRVITPEGTAEARITTAHSSAEPQVDLARRLTSSNIVWLDTRADAASGAEAVIDSADNGGAFGVGQVTATSAITSFNGSWGLSALKLGPDAENVTATHRSNLQAWLGF